MRQWAFDICRDSGKKIDALVAEIGIGGSITGARKFKQKNADIKVYFFIVHNMLAVIMGYVLLC